MIHEETCPYCKGRNLIIAEQVGEGRVKAREVLTLEAGHLYHIVCLHCGTVVRTFMEDPAELLSLDNDAHVGEIEFSTKL